MEVLISGDCKTGALTRIAVLLPVKSVNATQLAALRYKSMPVVTPLPGQYEPAGQIKHAAAEIAPVTE